MIESVHVDVLAHFFGSGALYCTSYCALRSAGNSPLRAGIAAFVGVTSLGMAKELSDLVLSTGTPDLSDVLANEVGIAVFAYVVPYDASKAVAGYIQELFQKFYI